jgi:uncharacterized membrane protein
MLEHPVHVLAVLLVTLAALFQLNRTALGARVFGIVPLLVFAYFVPALLSNTGVIPTASPLYEFVKDWLLPTSLLLLTLSVDIPAIVRLGPKVLILFFSATAGIVIGGPLALLLVGAFAPDAIEKVGEQGWKGLAALSGSWIGGGANFIAIGKSVGATEAMIAIMVVVDVAVANTWTAVLLFFAGRNKAMDDRIGADRRAVDAVREKVEGFQTSVARPTNLPDLLTIVALGIGGTALASGLSYGMPAIGWDGLPVVGEIINQFTWVVILVTALGVGLSFTRARNLEGSGASSVGSVLLYLLVASIGAHANFRELGDVPVLAVVGAVWMLFHAVTILLVRRATRAPIFFAAVGSQANVGGAASAPIVASAFHPALAPVGVLLAVLGYVVGTYAGLACAWLLELAYGVIVS